MPPLKTIWEDQYCQQDNKFWTCLRCGNVYKPKHATRAAAHFAKVKGIGVTVCTAIIPPADAKRYSDLYSMITLKCGARKRAAEDLFSNAASRQDLASMSYLEKKLRLPMSTVLACSHSSHSTAQASAMTYSPKERSPRAHQSSISG